MTAVPKPSGAVGGLLACVGTGLAAVVAAELPKVAGGLVFCWATLEVASGVAVEAPELVEELTC